MRLYPSYCERNSIFVKFYVFMIKPKLRTVKAEVVVTCEYNGEEIYKYTWSNASFYCDPSESFDIKRKTSIDNQSILNENCLSRKLCHIKFSQILHLIITRSSSLLSIVNDYFTNTSNVRCIELR